MKKLLHALTILLLISTPVCAGPLAGTARLAGKGLRKAKNGVVKVGKVILPPYGCNR